LNDEDRGFVDRAPEINEVAKGHRGPLGEPLERSDRVRVLPPSAIGEPSRQREVIQRDEGGDSGRAHCHHLRAIALDRREVPRSGRRLES
jgi:hypothetical protein